ncbi:hypothetical protein HYU14_04600 [Candidatus Woesearchaeota archaeon]|nr:hypothetical protein [Candidatus Woesearchaeota archaeon]
MGEKKYGKMFGEVCENRCGNRCEKTKLPFRIKTTFMVIMSLAIMMVPANAISAGKYSSIAGKYALIAGKCAHWEESEGEKILEQAETKVAICHVPQGNFSAAHTIEVSRSASQAHLIHGDVLGKCAEPNGFPEEGAGDEGDDIGDGDEDDDGVKVEEDGIKEDENSDEDAGAGDGGSGQDDSGGEFCIQVIQPAINDEAGECREFSTPCDVPDGWTAVQNCS